MKKRGLIIALSLAALVGVSAYAMFYRPAATGPDPVIQYPSGIGDGLDPTINIIQENRRLVEEVTVSRENAQEIVAMLRRPEEYETVCDISYYHEGLATRSLTVQLWVIPEMQKALQRSASMDDWKHTVLAGDMVYIWNASQSGVEYSGKAGSFTVDDIGHIITHEQVLRLEESSIISADLQLTGEGSTSLLLEAVNPLSGYREVYQIGVDTGLLQSCRVYDGDRCVYEMRQASLALTVSRETAFILPNGANLYLEPES